MPETADDGAFIAEASGIDRTTLDREAADLAAALGHAFDPIARAVAERALTHAYENGWRARGNYRRRLAVRLGVRRV